MEDNLTTSFKEKFDVVEKHYGHRMGGIPRDGYGTCKLCGVHGNEKAILLPCEENPFKAENEKLRSDIEVLQNNYNASVFMENEAGIKIRDLKKDLEEAVRIAKNGHSKRTCVICEFHDGECGDNQFLSRFPVENKKEDGNGH